MPGMRETPEEVVSKLWQLEALHRQGVAIADAVRQIGVTQNAHYREVVAKRYGNWMGQRRLNSEI